MRSWPSGVCINARVANVLEPDQAVDRRSLDLRLAFELEAEFDEEDLAASRSPTTMRTLSIR
jgi:hypothetical protein